MTFEVVPLDSVRGAVASLPGGSRVSITASPTRGLAPTFATAEWLVGLGFNVVPHISARLVRDVSHVAGLSRWFCDVGVKETLLVGGDIREPGGYVDVISLLRALLEFEHGLTSIGVAAYPDGHPFIGDDTLHGVLHEKQRLLSDAGLEGFCSTQMCFDPDKIVNWLRIERDAGLELPVHLGVCGVVERSKLLATGARLGVGASLSYLRKNRAIFTKMAMKRRYEPDDLLRATSAHLADLGVTGIHVFTFNQLESTAAWRDAALSRFSSGAGRDVRPTLAPRPQGRTLRRGGQRSW